MIAGATIAQVPALPDTLPGGTSLGRQMEVAPGTLLLKIPAVGKYLVRDGRSIEYTVQSGADPNTVELYLFGAARSALLHQRGELALHGATLLPPGRACAVTLCGDSGVGKSTLAVELLRRGWKFLADDMTRVSWHESKPQAWPSRENAKLWADACSALGIDTLGLRRVRPGMEKFYVQMPIEEEPRLLGLVLVLALGGTGVQVVESAPEKMSLLSRHSFRAKQIRPMGVLPQHLRMVAQVASACVVGRVHGAHENSIEHLAESVQEALSWLPTSS